MDLQILRPQCKLGAVLAMFENLTTYMMIGIVIIVVVSQFNRLLGSGLAVLFWIAVAAVGYAGYQAGGSLGLPGLKLSLTQFLVMCGALAGVQAFGIYAAIKRKRIREAYRETLEESD